MVKEVLVVLVFKIKSRLFLGGFYFLTIYKKKNMKIAICAIIKDEQRYLEEWLQYHFKLGFDEIYLYEDLESTSHKEICDKYENVFLDKIENHFQTDRINIRRQRELYELFIEKYKDSFDWVAFIDIDEFIMTENNLDLKTIFEECIFMLIIAH